MSCCFPKVAPPEATDVVARDRRRAIVPTRFLPLEDLISHGQLPRYGRDKDFKHSLTGEPNAILCKPREDFDAATTCFVYISHCWLRPNLDPWLGHPDDEEKRKYKLIVAVLNKLSGGAFSTPIPAGMKVAVWIDYCCIEQHGPPASEIENLGNLMASCDMVVTPIVDVDHASWEAPATWTDYFVQYKAEGWQEYLGRGWCRLEAMLATVKPVAKGRAELFRGAMKASLVKELRPHVVFGTKELEESKAPIFLPPRQQLLHSAFDKNRADEGKLTIESDREVVRMLAEDARKDVKQVVVGWHGKYKGKGIGRGKIVYQTGDYAEGKFKDGALHGKGKHVAHNGDVYEGDYKEGKKDGSGRNVFSDGATYEGQFVKDLMHGTGKFVFVSGNVYEGDWEWGKKHGRGKWTWEDGTVDIQRFEANQRVGEGARWSADRAQAWELQGGNENARKIISLQAAAEIAGRIGLQVPSDTYVYG